jgi:hypothetical protein
MLCGSSLPERQRLRDSDQEPHYRFRRCRRVPSSAQQRRWPLARGSGDGSAASVPHSSDFVARLLRAKASPPGLLNDRERPEDH